MIPKRYLVAWADARDRFQAAAEAMAELNIRTDYQRPNDHPVVLEWDAANRAYSQTTDELYQLARAP